MERSKPTQMVDKIKKHAIIACLEPNVSTGKLAAAVVDSRINKARRFRAGVKLLRKPFELAGIDVQGRFENQYIDTENLPSKAKEVKMLGSGGESYVFTFGEGHVVKMDQASLSLTLDQKIEKAKQLQSNHQQLQEWFSDVEGFIPNSLYLVGAMPYQNREAVATVQPYVENPRDLLGDFEDHEIYDLLKKNPLLRSSLIKVGQKVFDIMQTEDSSIDIFNEKNINIVTTDNTPRLVLLDTGIIQNVSHAVGPQKKYGEHFPRIFYDKTTHLKRYLQYATDLQEQMAPNMQDN